jgi:lactate dehydrogenase-like 2-hydroxyacid dehydrogenase
LINIARGSIVDEEALVEALQDGRLGAFASDVFAHEPHVPEALLEMPNVILAPHIGSATVDTRTAMGELMLKNLERFFAGEPLETPVRL